MGESLFRLAEALPRTLDRANQLALVSERIPALRSRPLAALALPVIRRAIDAVGAQFVFAESIETALERARRAARRDARRRFSFDMLGEGARSDADARRNLARYRVAAEVAGRAAANADAVWRARLGVSISRARASPRAEPASAYGL